MKRAGTTTAAADDPAGDDDAIEDEQSKRRRAIQRRQQRFECDLTTHHHLLHHNNNQHHQPRRKLKSRSTSSSSANVDHHRKQQPQQQQQQQDDQASFQQAVACHRWEVAESLIAGVVGGESGRRKLNDGLCIALDSVWFLRCHEEVAGVIGLMQKIVKAGATDFTRAALRTSFLASCVSACRSRTMSLSDTVNDMAQRLRDRLRECNGDEDMKAEAAAKVQKFTEWALKCIGSHTRGSSSSSSSTSNSRCCCCRPPSAISHNSMNESQLQLMAFKRFLQLAGDNLTPKDYTEAFDAACFPLTLFSSAIDPGWATGIAASAMQGLLGMLLQGGADNVNQCFLEAARFGSTELVRILLQIARNGPELDVNLALGFASHYCKIGTMECLVYEGKASSFLGPLMRAAERGCIQVVEWLVGRGCKDMELCLALTAAVSSSKLDAAAYLLRHVPKYVLETLSFEILKAAGERSAGSHKGIEFLLQADFLSDPETTYTVADTIATSEEEGISQELKVFLQQEWSEEAFAAGRAAGAEHYVNFMRALRRGCSGLSLQELPVQLQACVAYLPLYKECAACGGVLVSQRLRGQLVEAVSRLVSGFDDEQVLTWRKESLLEALGKHLPAFLV